MNENPFEAPREEIGQTQELPPSGAEIFGRIVHATIMLVLALASGYFLLMYLGVSTMLPSTLTGLDRAKEVARSFLFGGGVFQVFVIGFLLLSLYGSIGQFTYLVWNVVFKGSPHKNTHVVIWMGAISLSLLTIACIYLVMIS